jgi:hypothetical protein
MPLHPRRRRPSSHAHTFALALVAGACGVDVPVAADATDDADDTASDTDAADDASSSSGPGDHDTAGDDDGQAPSTTGVDESDGGQGPKLDVEGPDGDDQPMDCAPDNDLIWVMVMNEERERQAELHRFDPDAPGFEWVTDLDCLPLDDFGDQPMSLGAERGGRVLVASVMPDLWTFDVTSDDPCSTLAMAPWAPPSSANSLAFAGVDPDLPGDDRMYTHSSMINVISGNEGQLGWTDLDASPAPVATIGATAVPFMTLTGTADGRVYGLGGTDRIFDSGLLVRLDVDTGATAEMLADDVPAGHLAYYAGDLILFDLNYQAQNEWAPRVMRYDLDDDDGSGEHELVEIFGEPDSPPNLWIRGVASPTCVPQGPRG